MTQKTASPPQRQIQVELPADLEAIYANFAILNHSPSEVIIDFARMLPNMPKVKVYARILMTPTNAKALHKALEDNLAKYEKRFGEIKIAPEELEAHERSMGFVQRE
ncbi:MAG TPA: DUF3467 domain-containing protein [Anaerolineae bacterium]|nr:DUF3467 domain-containing protein [Anaerolineae bacterium]